MIWRSVFDWRTMAVLHRNRKVYFRNWKTAFLPPLLEPVIMFLAFGLGLGGFVGSMVYDGRKVPYLEFIAPGVMVYALFSTAFFECLYGSFVRMFYQKTFEGLLGTGVERTNVIWGEILWGAVRAMLYGVCVSVVFVLFNLVGFTCLSLFPLLFLVPAGGLVSIAFSSLALIFTAKVPTIDHMNYPVFLVGVPLSLVSNTYFPIDGLHPIVTAFASVNPLYHMSRIFRHFMLGGGIEPWMGGAMAVILAALFVTVVFAHRLMDRRMEREP